MLKEIIVIGTGGLAREVTEWVKDLFVINGYSGIDADEYGKYNLPGKLYSNDVTPEEAGTNYAVIAIGTPMVRAKVFTEFSCRGWVFPTILHPTATVATTAILEQGVMIAPNCVVGPSVFIGTCAYINFSVGIGHDAKIGKYVQINPGAQIGGFAKIGDLCLVGAGSTILNGIEVCEKAKVGVGSVCFGKVKKSSTVLGNPARRLRSFESD